MSASRRQDWKLWLDLALLTFMVLIASASVAVSFSGEWLLALFDAAIAAAGTSWVRERMSEAPHS